MKFNFLIIAIAAIISPCLWGLFGTTQKYLETLG
jgi:hypothetical protein